MIINTFSIAFGKVHRTLTLVCLSVEKNSTQLNHKGRLELNRLELNK